MASVISLDKGRINVREGKLYKKTTEEEYQNMCLAREKLTGDLQQFYLGTHRYSLRIPKDYGMQNGKIAMDYIKEANLELILRDPLDHAFGVRLLNYLISYFVYNKFYWLDFAPRNILVGKDEIYLVDFERGFAEEEESLLSFFREYPVYEEYAAFLLYGERVFTAEEVLQKGIPVGNISSNEIKSQRVIEILKKTGKYKEAVSYTDYYNAICLIVEAERPVDEGGRIIFPIVELEEYLTKYGHEKYAEKVLEKKPKIVL